MANTYLKGALGFKGARGYSAYDIAVQNGYVGTETEWLATLGTSSHFTEEKTMYTSTVANETILDLPEEYTSNSFLDIYVEGIKLDSNAYTINTTTRKITLVNPLELAGTKVEIVCLTMSTNNLPIVDAITSQSTNETTPGTKAVYDALALKENSSNKVTSIVSTSTDAQYPSAKAVYTKAATDLALKLDKANIQVVTGNTGSAIAVGETITIDVDYPTGFTKGTTVILGSMVSSNNNYYDTSDLTDTANGFPVIKTIALTDETMKVWLKNNSTSTARIGYYKITIMKVGA